MCKYLVGTSISRDINAIIKDVKKKQMFRCAKRNLSHETERVL